MTVFIVIEKEWFAVVTSMDHMVGAIRNNEATKARHGEAITQYILISNKQIRPGFAAIDVFEDCDRFPRAVSALLPIAVGNQESQEHHGWRQDCKQAGSDIHETIRQHLLRCPGSEPVH
jgi:hypothetical protein